MVLANSSTGLQWENPNTRVILPWGRAINAGRLTGDGRMLDRIMSALELVGPLLALCSAPMLLKGRPLRFHVDNSGSVFIFKKGSALGSCSFCLGSCGGDGWQGRGA